MVARKVRRATTALDSPLWSASELLLGSTAGTKASDRQAACTLLAGCTGRRALLALTKALDDNAASVRSSAVTALAHSAERSSPARLAPAIFHRRDDVRTAALRHPACPPDLLFALLALHAPGPQHDEVIQALVAQARMPRTAQRLAGAVLRARRRGVVDEDTALDLLRLVPWTSAELSFTELLRGISHPELRHYAHLGADVAALTRAMSAVDDQLTDLLIFAQQDVVVARGVLSCLSTALLLKRVDDSDRLRVPVAVGIAAVAANIDPLFVGLAAVCNPNVLLLEQLPLELCKDSLRALSTWQGTGKPPPSLDRLHARKLHLHTSSSRTDIVAVAGLLRLSPSPPYSMLRRLVPSLGDAFAERPTVDLLSQPASGEQDKGAYLDLVIECADACALRETDGDEHDHLDKDALLDVVCALPADGMPFIRRLVDKAPTLAHTLLLRAIEGGDRFSDDSDDLAVRRRLRAIDMLVDAVSNTALSGLLRACADVLDRHAAPHGARTVLLSIVRRAGADMDALLAAHDDARATRINAIVRGEPLLSMAEFERRLATGGATAIAAVDEELRIIPGGARGLVALALSLGEPVGGHLAHALALRGERERAALRPAIDPRAYHLLEDILRGDTLADDDPRRAPLLSLLPPTPAPAPPLPFENDLQSAIVQTLAVPALTTYLDDADVSEVLALLRTALVLSGADAHGVLAYARALPKSAREEPVLEALKNAQTPNMLRHWISLLPATSTTRRMDALRDVARWGGRQAYAITGRGFDVAYVADALGHTRLTSRRVNVNPLPLLHGIEGGDAIVRGLIVHELGHHRYHADAASLTTWRQAKDEGLHQLLNLVADEHLERNLRAESPERYGAPLKTLAAWAFQHMEREVSLDQLLDVLKHNAAAVLMERPLLPGRLASHVVVDIGAALKALADAGSSFSRFIRVLRMGTADGRDDPKIAQAMTLFPAHDFRAASMDELFIVTKKLKAIFGDEVKILDVFDLHTLTDASADELAADGVDTDDLERVTNEARQSPRTRRPRLPGPRRGRVRNKDDDTDFDEIDTVQKLKPDRMAHLKVAQSVRRAADVLRQSLLSLGTTFEPERRRISGRRLDRSGLMAAVLKGDPRVLMSRREVDNPHLFIGVVIDCSGSMEGDNIDYAHHFGVTIAEACKGLRDVDVRFFGFTDEIIYDAGNALACAVTSLHADGGNNDAAALLHVARIAKRSRRKSVLLVMISDGSPTECSVSALRALVDQLMSRGVLCAQVAVESFAEEDICFDHHVFIDDGDVLGAARRFGSVMEKLVRLAKKN